MCGFYVHAVNNNLVNTLNNNSIVTVADPPHQFMPALSSRSALLGDHGRSASTIEAAMSITELSSINQTQTPYYQQAQCVPLYSQYYSESEIDFLPTCWTKTRSRRNVHVF